MGRCIVVYEASRKRVSLIPAIFLLKLKTTVKQACKNYLLILFFCLANRASKKTIFTAGLNQPLPACTYVLKHSYLKN